MMFAMWAMVMMMKAFRVSGSYSPKGKKWYRFTKDVIADDEKGAIEKSYSLLGSKFGIKRGLIKINDVKEIEPKKSNDPVVKFYMRDKNE